MLACTPAGGAKLCPAAAAATVAHWVQWEAEVLRPAVLTQGQPLVDALAQLTAALAGKTFLAGASATLADVRQSTAAPLLLPPRAPARRLPTPLGAEACVRVGRANTDTHKLYP
jgi:hypothetical protein